MKDEILKWMRINPKVAAAVIVYALAPTLHVMGVNLSPEQLALLSAYLVPAGGGE